MRPQDDALRQEGHALTAVARASLGYYVLQALLVVAGVISMPITTRLLSKAEYGLLSLCFSTLAVLTALAGAGLGNAAVRMFHETRLQGLAALRHLYEETVTAVACGALVVFGLTLAATVLGLGGGSEEYRTALRYGAGLIIVRTVANVLQQMLRVEERVAAYARVQLAIRFGTLVVAVGLLLLSVRAAKTVLVAATVVEVLVLGWLLFDVSTRQLLRRPRLSRRLVRALSYGVPLAFAGSARVVLDYGNRFVIERSMGLEAVATYVVPADLLTRMIEIIVLPMQLAAVPVLFRLWSTDGEKATARTASQVLTYTLVALLPTAALYLRFGEELVALIASTKYRGAGALTPWLLVGGVCGGLQFIAIVGATIGKQTMRVALLVVAATILNVGLNLVCVPRWGVIGAAGANSASYLALMIAQIANSRRVLPLRFQVRPLLCAGAATGLALLPTAFGVWPTAEQPVALLAAVAGLGALAVTLVVGLDGELRAIVLAWRASRTSPASASEGR